MSGATLLRMSLMMRLACRNTEHALHGPKIKQNFVCQTHCMVTLFILLFQLPKDFKGSKTKVQVRILLENTGAS